MSDQAGTTLRGYGRCPEYYWNTIGNFFPIDSFDLGQSIPSRTRMEAEQVRPRWLGHDLSEAPDSGIGRTQDSKTRRGSVGWCNQSTFQPTIPQPIRRKRRAGGRVVTVSDAGLDVGSEGAMWASVCGYRFFEWVGRCHGGSTACVSPRGGRPQRGPAGVGTPAGVARSFVRCANRTV